MRETSTDRKQVFRPHLIQLFVLFFPFFRFIAQLLEEAENERMHLLTFQQMRKPGIFFRSAVFLAQGIFWNLYFTAYIISPRFCHRFVGYLEEEAVLTYTHAIEALDDGESLRTMNMVYSQPINQSPEDISMWLLLCISLSHTRASILSTHSPQGRLPTWTNKPAPDIAKTYWGLAEDALMRDVLLAVRADEANHRDVNHTMSSLKENVPNPYIVQHPVKEDPRDEYSSSKKPTARSASGDHEPVNR